MINLSDSYYKPILIHEIAAHMLNIKISSNNHNHIADTFSPKIIKIKIKSLTHQASNLTQQEHIVLQIPTHTISIKYNLYHSRHLLKNTEPQTIISKYNCFIIYTALETKKLF